MLNGRVPFTLVCVRHASWPPSPPVPYWNDERTAFEQVSNYPGWIQSQQSLYVQRSTTWLRLSPVLWAPQTHSTCNVHVMHKKTYAWVATCLADAKGRHVAAQTFTVSGSTICNSAHTLYTHLRSFAAAIYYNRQCTRQYNICSNRITDKLW